MVTQKVQIINPTGLHLRPAGIFCQEAMKYTSNITFRYGINGTANACIKSGDEIEIVCDGDDEAPALEALVALVENGFGE